MTTMPFQEYLISSLNNTDDTRVPPIYGFADVQLREPPSYAESFSQMQNNNSQELQPPSYRSQSVSPFNNQLLNESSSSYDWCVNSPATSNNLHMEEFSPIMNCNYSSPAPDNYYNPSSPLNNYQDSPSYLVPNELQNLDQLNLMSDNSCSPSKTPEYTMPFENYLGQQNDFQQFNEDSKSIQFLHSHEGIMEDISDINTGNFDGDVKELYEMEDIFDPSQCDYQKPKPKPQNVINIPLDPRNWSSEDLDKWLGFHMHTSKTLQVSCNVHNLPRTGQELCSLSIRQLQVLVGNRDGIIMGEELNNLLARQKTALPTDDDPYRVYSEICKKLAVPGTQQIALWQFLLDLLSDRKNEHVIFWADSNGECQIRQPDELARKWGDRKNKKNMNYDKLSRAIRYYYDRKLLTKVQGKKYAYQIHFSKLETEWNKRKQDVNGVSIKFE